MSIESVKEARTYIRPDATTDVDVIVIGGGVNGTGVARDLALRGLRVELIEKHDLAFGASGNSSGMIHGGVRYLTSHPSVTESSCRDSGYIQKIAPHLLFRIPFLMPVRAGSNGSGKKLLLTLMDAFFKLYDDYQPLKRGKMHTRLTADELTQLEPGLVGDMVGGITFDEWGIDGARLCTLNALDAIAHRANVRLHTEVIAIERHPEAQGRAVSAVRWRNRLSGDVGKTSCKVIVNATGAWGPLTTSLVKAPLRVRPGKGIHLVYDRRLTNYAIVGKAIDGRQVFLEPWQNMSVLGTTDTDYYGDLDDVRPTADEVRYLIQAVSAVFPALRRGRVVGIYTGVRPSLYEYGVLPDKVSREHEIVDHGEPGKGAMPGFFSMIGGKLASYRIFAEEMSDVVARLLNVDRPCQTHMNVLPGGDSIPSAIELAERTSVHPVAARRLVYRHGNRAHLVMERLQKKPEESRVVCHCEPVLESEIRHVIREEMAQTVDDVARRTRLGLGTCGGMRCALRCGQIVAEETGISQLEGMKQALRFLTRQRTYRAPAMGPEQARQEAFLMAHLVAQTGITFDEHGLLP